MGCSIDVADEMRKLCFGPLAPTFNVAPEAAYAKRLVWPRAPRGMNYFPDYLATASAALEVIEVLRAWSGALLTRGLYRSSRLARHGFLVGHDAPGATFLG